MVHFSICYYTSASTIPAGQPASNGDRLAKCLRKEWQLKVRLSFCSYWAIIGS